MAQVIRDIANLTYAYALDEIEKAQKDLKDITRKAYQDLQKRDEYVPINEMRKIIEWLYNKERDNDYYCCKECNPYEIFCYTKVARTLRGAMDCLEEMANTDLKNLDDYESFRSKKGEPPLNDDIKKRISYELNRNDGDVEKAEQSIRDKRVMFTLQRLSDLFKVYKVFEHEIEVQGEDGVAIDSKEGLHQLKWYLNRIGERAVNYWLYDNDESWVGEPDVQKLRQMRARGKENCWRCSGFVKSKKNNIKTLITQLSQFQDTLLNEYLGTYGVRYTHIMQQLYQLHDIATFGKKIITLLAFKDFDKEDSIQIYAAGQFNGGITFYKNSIELSTGFNTKVGSIYFRQGEISRLYVRDLIDFADKMSTDYWLCISLESIFKIVEKEIEEKEKILKKLEEYPCLLPPYLLPYDCVYPELISEGVKHLEEKLLEKNPYLKPLEQNLEKIRGKLHVIDKIVEESYRDEVFLKPILERMRVQEECIYLLNKEKIEKAANTVMDILEINIRVMAYMHDTLIININNSFKNRSWITRLLFGYNPAKDFVIRTMDCDFNNLGLYLKTLRPDIDLELEKPTLDNIRKIRNEYKDSDRFTIGKAARELKDKYKATAVRLNNYDRTIDNLIRRLKENILKAVVRSGYPCSAKNIILSELDEF